MEYDIRGGVIRGVMSLELKVVYKDCSIHVFPHLQSLRISTIIVGCTYLIGYS